MCLVKFCIKFVLLSICFATPVAGSASLCASYSGIPDGEASTAGMVWVKPGTYIMGNDHGHKDESSGRYLPYREERAEHSVKLDGFWIDHHEVTNAQFTEFVEATGYVTMAEREPKKEWFPPDYPAELMIPGSAVFISPDSIQNNYDISQWWQFIEGANWRQPQGPGSNIKDKMNHPVVHVTHQDAQAYAKWAGKSLPTEAQWEYAARGGLEKQSYSWGNSFKPNGKWMANTWQGEFPVDNTAYDGYTGTSPVGCFPPNEFGIYDVAGNVWEIVQDNYLPGHKATSTTNPKGPSKSFDPADPETAKHVIKGGSYLCTPNYCMRYRPAARQPQDYTMSTSHIGFRTVLKP